MASTSTLSAATQDRKARLAQLKNLKRKQPADDDSESSAQPNAAKSPRYFQDAEPSIPTETDQIEDQADAEEADVTSTYLSGRNYSTLTKSAKLGFEEAPSSTAQTLEARASSLAAESKRAREEEERAEKEGKEPKPLDLFQLQPKKPNWDLKRDLERKLEILNVRTDNAIARMVRERVEAAKRKTDGSATNGDGDGEAAGLDGATLVEATNVREREDEEEARREREEVDDLGE